MTQTQQKKLLRTAVRGRERELSSDYKQEADKAIVQHICALEGYQRAERVFCFVGTRREIDTTPLLMDVLEKGKWLLVPLCTAPGEMELRRITALDQLCPGAYGILEPVAETQRVDRGAVDFAVVPCLSCDRKGHRLGQGGGYYDRFFEGCEIPSALVCREELMEEEIPVEEHDVVFRTVVTEQGVYEIGDAGGYLPGAH